MTPVIKKHGGKKSTRASAADPEGTALRGAGPGRTGAQAPEPSHVAAQAREPSHVAAPVARPVRISNSAARPSLRQRKKERTRARIIEEAVRIFSQRGLAEPTVEEIAVAAEVGKGTIYNYFATKEEIVVAYMAGVEERVQAKLRQFVKSDAPLEDLLAEFLLFQFRLKESRVEFDRVFLAHMFMHTGQFLPYMAELQKSIDPVLEELFLGLQERGAIRTDLDLPDLILVFKTIHLGLSALWAIEGPPFQGTEKVIRQEMLLFSQGLERKNHR